MAAAIIAAGPEPLQSQFATGYNMAANLLRTRSLEEARAFIERSFGNYLGVVPAHRAATSPVRQSGRVLTRRLSSVFASCMMGLRAHKQHEMLAVCSSAVMWPDLLHGSQAATAAGGGEKRPTP